MATTISVLDVQLIDGDNGPDNIFYEVDLPNGSYPFKGFAMLKLTVASGTGRDYIKANFPEFAPT